MIDEPLRRAVEKGGGRMNIDRGAFHESLVALLGIFFSGVAEEAAADRKTNAVVVSSSADDVVFVSGRK